MKRLLLLLSVLLLLLPLLLLGTALLAPAIVLPPLANLLLAESGVRVESMREIQLGWEKAEAAAIQLDVESMQITVEAAEVSYRPGELLAGKLREIRIDRIGIIPRTSETTEAAPNNRVLEDLLAPLSGLPFSSLLVGELRYDGEPDLAAEFSVTTAPLKVSSRLTSPGYEDWSLEIDLQETAPRHYTGEGVVNTADGELLRTELVATVQNDDLSVEMETGLDLGLLQANPDLATYLGDLIIAQDSLRLNGRFRLLALSSAPSLAELTLSVDNTESLVQIDRQQGETLLSAQLHLPLRLTATAEENLEHLALSANEVAGTLNVDSDAFFLDSELAAEQLELHCLGLSSCNLALSVDLAIRDWKAESVSGNGARLAGTYNLALNDGAITLGSPAATLSLPEIRTSDRVAAAEVQFSDLLVDVVGETLRTDITTTLLNPGIKDLTLNNPGLNGQLTASATSLSADLTLNLNNRLQATLLVEQALGEDGLKSGSAVLTLQDYVFTDSFNLASLVSYAGLEMDLVAGGIGGDATLNWQPGDDDSWHLSGPVRLALEEVSGIVADSFFVGLDTELRAGFTDGPGLATDDLLEAILATVDVGLPLNRIDWRYGFDTSAGLFTVQDLHTDLLGGSLQVAEFQYDLNAPRNRLEVALVDLDLATIVALANYPNLQVSGAISGYIPLLIEPGGMTVEQGLISALNPGGTIRYTATNPGSGNSGLELVNRALSNYQFDNLDSEVSYGEDGELEMAVHLKGMNPEFEDGRRINLNVTISDNIPALLQSLQAGRVITERLEQHLNRQ